MQLRYKEEMRGSKMVIKGKQRIRSNNCKNSTSNFESLRGKLHEDHADLDYKNHLGYKNHLSHEFDEHFRPESSRKRREIDSKHDYHDDDEEKEKDDPQLLFFLDRLKEDDKSYRFEHKVNGCPSFIKYEGAYEVSNRECIRTKSGAEENKDMKMTRRLLRKKSKIEKDKDIESMDRDYYYFLKHFRVVNDHAEYNNGTDKAEYELRMVECIQVKEEREDVSYSDVEIIDSTAFYKMDKSSDLNEDTTELSEFKRRVIAALRKPFDREEYKKLRRDIKHHTAKERHLDLRNGREKPIGTQEDGKSYLDHFPVLKKKFQLAKGDKPKRLNLLRGFFLWIKKPCDKFLPWTDNECLAVYPDSSNDGL